MNRCFSVLVLGALTLLSTIAMAANVSFVDPAGDDFGPGTYIYPTDAIYTPGSFDLRKVELKVRGARVEIKVTLGAVIEDPWNSRDWTPSGNGFSIQMIQVYVDTDGKPGSGHTDTLPGIHASFDSRDAWDRVIVISPQGASRLRAEAKTKAGALAKSIVIPTKVVARGKTLIATIKKKDLGGAPSSGWGYQVVVQSNEGYPDKQDFLSRKVNEFAGDHRFGGGNDWDCDPHVLDILTGEAKGAPEEKDLQKSALSYTCGDDGASVKRAMLPMIRKP